MEMQMWSWRGSPWGLLAAGVAALGCASPAVAPPLAKPAPPSSDVIESTPVTAPSWTLDRSTFDPSVAPCDDFYQHVCGGWVRTPPDVGPNAMWAFRQATARVQHVLDELLTGAPSDARAREAAGSADDDIARVRTFYASCMADRESRDAADQNALRRLLSRIDASKGRRELDAAMRELHGLGVNAWFRYTSERDRRNPQRYRGVIVQGDLGLGVGVYSDRAPASTARRDGYQQLIARMFERTGIPGVRARREAAAVLALETRLAAVALRPQEVYDPAVTEHPMAPDALRVLAPHIDWVAYFALVGHGTGSHAGLVAKDAFARRDARTGTSPVEDALNVAAPKHLRAVDQLLATRPLDELRAFLRWRLLDSLGPELPTELAGERARFREPDRAGEPRERVCELSTVRALGVELSRQFAHRAVGERGRSNARRVAVPLLATMADRVAATAWLSPVARSALADRVRRIDLKIGFPDRWPATGDFALAPDAYLGNVLAARAFERRRDWQRCSAPWQRLDWDMTVRPNGAHGLAAARLTIANGFPDMFTNSIIVTAATLQPPLFDPDAPLEAQYASFGALLGHELVHVLDFHEFDSDGMVRDLWTEQDIATYAARRTCVARQADRFAIDGAQLDGSRTLRENVADAAGIRFAYAALERELGDAMSRPAADGLTPAQRFFLAYAQKWCVAESPETAKRNLQTDSHGPPAFRVNGPLANMPELAAAFACAPGTAMVRPATERCTIW